MTTAVYNETGLATVEEKPVYAETPGARQVDRIASVLSQCPQVELPLTHRFTPGLYVREIFMPAGTVVISKIHKTEHPYVISKGRARVWTDECGVVELAAPHTGITKPGTRRVLLILEDCIWTTFHPTNETEVEKIEEQLIFKRERTEEIPLPPGVREQLQAMVPKSLK